MFGETGRTRRCRRAIRVAPSQPFCRGRLMHAIPNTFQMHTTSVRIDLETHRELKRIASGIESQRWSDNRYVVPAARAVAPGEQLHTKLSVEGIPVALMLPGMGLTSIRSAGRS